MSIVYQAAVVYLLYEIAQGVKGLQGNTTPSEPRVPSLQPILCKVERETVTIEPYRDTGRLFLRAQAEVHYPGDPLSATHRRSLIAEVDTIALHDTMPHYDEIMAEEMSQAEWGQLIVKALSTGRYQLAAYDALAFQGTKKCLRPRASLLAPWSTDLS